MTADPPTMAAGPRVDPRADDRAVNAAVRAEMARRDWTQAELAEQANRTTGWLADRLKLRVQWRVADVAAVARALDVPRSTLLPDPTED